MRSEVFSASNARARRQLESPHASSVRDARDRPVVSIGAAHNVKLE